jgi:tetratricopeptide (TPR) repeat protein
MKIFKTVLVAGLLFVLGCGGSTALRSGKVYYEKNQDYPRAEEWFRKAVVEEPNNWEAHFYLALSLAQQEKYAEAEKPFSKAMELAEEVKKEIIYSNQHSFFVKNYNKGITANSVMDYEEALEYFKKAVAVEPGYAKGHVNLGVTYSLLGDEEQALEAFKKAVEVGPDEVDGWRNLGITYRRMEDYSSAREAYEKVVELDAEDIDGLRSLGEMYFMEENYEKALDSYRKAAEKKGDEPWLQFQMGAAYFSSKQFSESAVAYQKAAALSKQSDEDLYKNSMFNLSSAYLRLEQYEEAVATLQQLLEIEKTADVHERLGQAYAKQGDSAKALEEYKKAEALRGE